MNTLKASNYSLENPKALHYRGLGRDEIVHLSSNIAEGLGPNLMQLPNIKLQRLHGTRNPPQNCLPLICVAKNELYFWPFFLAHYRSLGVGHFVVLDDHSTDESVDFLSTQPDVSVLRANMNFADMYRKNRPRAVFAF